MREGGAEGKLGLMMVRLLQRVWLAYADRRGEWFDGTQASQYFPRFPLRRAPLFPATSGFVLAFSSFSLKIKIRDKY